MSNLISRSTSQTVAENSLATAIAFPESSDTDFVSSALLVAVTALPSDGMVVLADGITQVTLGETLTVAQLIGLKFRPTLDSFGTTSTFAFSVSIQLATRRHRRLLRYRRPPIRVPARRL